MIGDVTCPDVFFDLKSLQGIIFDICLSDVVVRWYANIPWKFMSSSTSTSTLAVDRHT